MAIEGTIDVDGAAYLTAEDIGHLVQRDGRTVTIWARRGRFPRAALRREGRNLWALGDVVRALRALRIDVPWSWAQAAR